MARLLDRVIQDQFERITDLNVHHGILTNPFGSNGLYHRHQVDVSRLSQWIESM
jgi:hypothetical protein